MCYFSALKANTKNACARITQSRTTTAFFVFSFIVCLVQTTVIQSLLFSIDTEYNNLVSGIVKGGNIPPANFTFLEGYRGHLHLQICDDIPTNQIPYPCTTVYSPPVHLTGPVQMGRNRQPFVLDGREKDINVTTIFSPSNATKVLGVQIQTPHGPIKTLDEQCIQILLHPSQVLQHLRQEDITWLCLQFWLLVISFIAVLHGSVPHTLAALMTRTLETAWTVYAVVRNPLFRDNFQELLADPAGPCSFDLFSAYWTRRQVYEITDLAVNIAGLILFSYLSWTLLKVYNAQSFKCVGAPQHIMRIHKFFMAVLACFQLEVFFLITSVGLWSRVFMTAVAHIPSHSAHIRIYKILYLGTVILLLPWLAMGWYSIRREMKKMMIAFLGIAFVFTCCSSIMFYSTVYRWSFGQWPYLGCYTVGTLIILIATIILGIICRMNFGKGLAQYLHAEETLASLNFAPDSFSHDTRGKDASLWKELDMKVLHLDVEDKYYEAESTLPPVYFVQLPKDGSGGDSKCQ